MNNISYFKYSLYILLFIVISAAAFNAAHHSSASNEDARILKLEVTGRSKRDTVYHNASAFMAFHSVFDAVENKPLDMSDLALLLLIMKYMLMLFSKLIIILSYIYFIALCIRRWILLESNSKNLYYIMHYLKLKDGKKSAHSIPLTF